MPPRHALLLLTLAALATACIDLDFSPPVPRPSLNAAGIYLRTDVLTTCGTVTWTLAYGRQGQDVTGEAWYALTESAGPPVKTPVFTLAVDSAHPDREWFSAEPVTERRERITDPAFADAVHHTFTCARTGESAEVHQTRPPSTGSAVYFFAPVDITSENGLLTAR